jgi:segregation and condensation protein A
LHLHRETLILQQLFLANHRRQMAQVLEFEEGRPRRECDDSEAALVVDVDGFEGPLDLLLELARRQKVDLTKISILALAEQYLVFIEEARKLRLELAADYLVMAAWLAYLKSRLLLPDPPKGEEPSAADLATALALRLKRLEVIRAAATKLAERPRLGRDIFARGAPEPIEIHHRPIWEASLFDLLSAYARQRQKQAASHITMKRREVWSLAQAREALERLLGHSVEWISLDQYLLRFVTEPAQRATVIASALSATLEMVREGKLALRQEEAFGALWIKPSIREEVAS